jgi:N,N'-diacetyllegionaminate synthase
MVREIEIGKHKIGPGHRCFIIAEAGVNHNGDLDLALKLVDIAAAAGADAVKFQLFLAEEQVSKNAKTVGYQLKHTASKTMLEMVKLYDLSWESHRQIFKHCKEVGIIYMASCFDKNAVDFLIDLGGDCIKVGSGEITNFPLLAYMASTKRPILLSTGMSEFSDIAMAVEHIRVNGEAPLALFQCVSSYPADPASINLRTMQTMAIAFGVPVGFSDHTIGSSVASAAIAIGASLIEKHFTLDKSLPGPDHAMSLDPNELNKFVSDVRNAEVALGDGVKRLHPDEKENQVATRRSLVSVREIKSGEQLDDTNVTLKRPATGIDPRLWDSVRGRKVKVDIPFDVPITWEMLD